MEAQASTRTCRDATEQKDALCPGVACCLVAGEDG